MGAGELEDALQTFSTLIKSHPEFTEAWNKRATVYFLLGRHHLNPNPSPNPNPNSNPDPDQVRACFLRFVASARLMDQRCACHPSGLPCDTASGAGALSGLQNCHPSTTWRSWAPPSAVYSKGLSTY